MTFPASAPGGSGVRAGEEPETQMNMKNLRQLHAAALADPALYCEYEGWPARTGKLLIWDRGMTRAFPSLAALKEREGPPELEHREPGPCEIAAWRQNRARTERHDGEEFRGWASK